LECTVCKTKAQLALKRCKHFELGYEFFFSTSMEVITSMEFLLISSLYSGDKKTKGAALVF
jgi:hypothetical protein